MNTIAIIMICILLIIICTLIFIIFLTRKKMNEEPKKEIDYKAFYIMGISFLPLGIILTVTVDNPGFIGFTGLGACYIAIGLANKDKWKKKE